MVKTFEEACNATGHDPEKLPDVSMLPEKHQVSLVAYFKLIIIIEALNEGWQPDWSNWDEYKYYAWFEVRATKTKTAGVGFSDSNYGISGTSTAVGSRLCLKSYDLAIYAGKKFKQLYQQYLLIG